MIDRLLCWLLAIALVVLGCSHHTAPQLPGAPPVLPPAAPAKLWVGTARADLTMPPGPASFGHGPDARVADGYWTRTYCRVFYFESEGSPPFVLAPCELPAMSLLLQRLVAERANLLLKEDKLPALHASRLMMTATHTHAGVGHYFGAAQYTGIFSSRLPGYDDGIAVDLAQRIATAIKDAAKNRQRAQLTWRYRDDFWCFTRNRSLDAYQLNRPPFVAPNAPECTEGFPALAAVDPSLDLLRIDRYDEQADPKAALVPIGSISFFAMHPTVVHSSNQLFGGDVFGVVSRETEALLRREQCAALGGCEALLDPLHAIVNTNEGDISPVWHEGDIEEAIKRGRSVSVFVASTHERVPEVKPDPAPLLDARYMEEDIRRAKFTEDGQVFGNCPFPQVGQGAARGGTDHRTSVAGLSMFGTDPVVDYDSQCCHAPKIPLLGPISVITRATGAFPSTLPFSVVNLGGTLITFMPAELTITAGQRLKKRVLSELKDFPNAPKRVIVAGLANEYIQYVATAEEYQYQDYEGASTLFGPNSARYLANRAALLARALFDEKIVKELDEKAQVKLGETHELKFKYGPAIDTRMQPSTGYVREHLGTCVMPDTVSSTEPPRICMYWRDGGPADVAIPSAPWVSVITSGDPQLSARVCAPDSKLACDPGALVDDRGYEFITRIHEQVGSSWVWSTLYTPTPETWRELQHKSVRIFVRGTGKARVESQSFGAGCLPARCSVRQSRLCLIGVITDDWRGLVPED